MDNNAESREANVNSGDEVEDRPVSCPVCMTELGNLKLLNRHLDNDHGFGDVMSLKPHTAVSPKRNIPSSPERNTLASSVKREQRKPQINRDHWKLLKDEHGKCSYCKRDLNRTTGVANCRKCGNLFCKRHCRNIMKLDLKAKYAPENGLWYLCCHNCFISKPGYQDYGTIEDLTDIYKSIRSRKMEDKRLRDLQLENRLTKLVDGITSIHIRYKDNILMPFKVYNEMSNLERSLTSWKDDKAVLDCYICLDKFNMLLRKHHCRLCGNVVCDQEKTNCSNCIPIEQLVSAASDLVFKESALDLSGINQSIRVCSNCVQSLFAGRKFKRDNQSPFSVLLSKHNTLENISTVITELLPTFYKLLTTLEISNNNDNVPSSKAVKELAYVQNKLLKYFTIYHNTARQISTLAPKNDSEKKIQQSIQQVSSRFINEKILPLKSVPVILNAYNTSDNNNNSSPEIKSLSDLMHNDLTIKEVKQNREELMVLKEQCFLVESMISDAKKSRKFEEISILNRNLQDLTGRIDEIQRKLGEQGFS